MVERIEEGNAVLVVMNSGQEFRGVVVSIPRDIGDCWLIKDEQGYLHAVQNYAEIVK